MANVKGFGRKRSWPNFLVLSRYLLGGTKKNTKTLSKDSRSPGSDFIPGPPEYEVVLTTPFGFRFIWTAGSFMLKSLQTNRKKEKHQAYLRKFREQLIKKNTFNLCILA
jgi:hypothetical protein